MATIPRSAALPAPTTVASARSGPSTRVSTVGGSSVEDVNNSSGVSFNSAAFGFREDTNTAFDGGQGEGRQQQYPGFVDAPTQAFAAMVQGGDFPRTDDDQSQPVPPGSVPYVGLTAKAIEIYETNARVLSGETAIRGTSFSVVL
jgi:hypothetical protein